MLGVCLFNSSLEKFIIEPHHATKPVTECEETCLLQLFVSWPPEEHALCKKAHMCNCVLRIYINIARMLHIALRVINNDHDLIHPNTFSLNQTNHVRHWPGFTRWTEKHSFGGKGWLGTHQYYTVGNLYCLHQCTREGHARLTDY